MNDRIFAREIITTLDLRHTNNLPPRAVEKTPLLAVFVAINIDKRNATLTKVFIKLIKTKHNQCLLFIATNTVNPNPLVLDLRRLEVSLAFL